MGETMEGRKHAVAAGSRSSNCQVLWRLQAAIEAGHSWPPAMSCLLLDTKHAAGS